MLVVVEVEVTKRLGRRQVERGQIIDTPIGDVTESERSFDRSAR